MSIISYGTIINFGGVNYTATGIEVSEDFMTEIAWLTSSNPAGMLNSLLKSVQMGDRDRKLRLFGMAWRSLAGMTTPDDFEHKNPPWLQAPLPPLAWVLSLTRLTSQVDAKTQAGLLRVIFGNPFKRYWWDEYNSDGPGNTALDVACLKWNDGTVPRMAEAIYERRSWEDCPVLADALEDAEFSDETILRWLRGEERCGWCSCGRVRAVVDDDGMEQTTAIDVCDICKGKGWNPRQTPSVRGDWVIDLLIGKN